MSSQASSRFLPLADEPNRSAGGGCGASCGEPATTATGPAVVTLIDQFLAEQATPTAVERFAREHEAGQLSAQAGQYRALMPATPPGAGQQYAFDVDLDTCTGCKACVTACRSLNGLDADETWRSVGLLVGDAGDGQSVQHQHVTTACHHCVDPGCLSGCPVDAYEKDPVTGVVAHLDDQCIGCGYCIMTCPYEVPRFDDRRGIVRKCDLCADRLADGEAPACVQACPTHAISVRVVDVAEDGQAAGAPWPFAAPDPGLTAPTTTYRTERDLSAAEPADLHALTPSRSHPALAVMLVFTQLAAGAAAVGLVVDASPVSALVALIAAVAGLGASVAHLGRPRYAHRAAIGVRHSWLSREVVALAVFTGLLGLDVAARLSGAGEAVVAALSGSAEPLVVGGLSVAAATAGLVGVGCSAMVYAVTGKRWWRLRTTGARFALTTLACGLAVVLAADTASDWLAGGGTGDVSRWVAIALPAVVAGKLTVEGWVLRHVRAPVAGELARTARLLTGVLVASSRWRVGLGVLGGIALPAWVAVVISGPEAGSGGAAVAAVTAAVALVAGELVERWQFFTAVSARRMPGRVR